MSRQGADMAKIVKREMKKSPGFSTFNCHGRCMPQVQQLEQIVFIVVLIKAKDYEKQN